MITVSKGKRNEGMTNNFQPIGTYSLDNFTRKYRGY